MEEKKDFNKWNKVKQRLDQIKSPAYAYPREIWWCSLGLNIGVEIDGKHSNFERPVIVLKVYNRESMLILSITTKPKNDRFHFVAKTNKTKMWIKLTQQRVISNKRPLRKIDVLSEMEFISLQKSFHEMLR